MTAAADAELDDLRSRIADYEAALTAIRRGGVDAVLLGSDDQQHLYTLADADSPYRVIVEEMGEGAATVSEHSTVLYSNRQLAALLGRERRDLVGSSILGHVVPSEADVLAELLTVAPGATSRAELTLLGADGEVPTLVSVTAIQLETMVLRCLVATDLRDRRSAAVALAAAQATNEFLSRVSHELRTPMNAVLGFGQLLERRLEGTEHVELVRQVIRAGSHLLGLINEVLDVSRIEAGELSVRLEPLSVTSVVDEVLRLMQPLAEEADITVTADGGPPDLHVVADPRRLRQVLLNLVSNGVKYNDAPGGVWVSWRAEGDEVSIRVRDDGRGIVEAVRHRVFAPFDRLGAERTGVEGTGIGLALTRGLVELMGGSVSVESVAGAGSTFAVRLPVARPVTRPVTAGSPETTQVVPRRSSAPDDTPASHTLLYIEDNEPNVRVMQAIVELRAAWQMVHSGQAQLGLDLARAHRPSLILLDVHLPDGSGLEVVTALRADSWSRTVPVVVLSADASDQQRERLLAGGADRYLTKPLDLDEVLAVLDHAAGLVAQHP